MGIRESVHCFANNVPECASNCLSPRFWPTFGGGNVVNLFDLASKHIQDTGRPYRIAVDLPYWSFHNLNEMSAQNIRQTSQGASQPIEKAVLYRMMRLAIHGIQVVLVVDGPQKPPKKNRTATTGPSLIKEKLELLKSTAEVLGIPWWQAPGEAEAECAQMQRLGLVDAVWSEDSDTFLFKGTTTIRFHTEANRSKSNTHARLLHMDEIAEKARGMDWRDLVLFAVIVGGDYDPKGLVQCGPKFALEAIRQGYGVSLARAFENGDMTAWRQKFKQFLEQQGSHVFLPIGFPSTQLLRDYIKPNVSSEQRLLSGISWNLSVDNAALRTIITSRYNFSVQENISWVVRMLLARRLLFRVRPDELALEFVRKVSIKESGNIPMSKVSFLLPAIMPRDLLKSWPEKLTKAASRIRPYKHVDRIECDIPDSIINLAFPNLQDVHKDSKSKISAALPAQSTGQGYTQAAVVKRKRGRPRKDANNAAPAMAPHKDTDHEKLREELASRNPGVLERSVERDFETGLSKTTFSALPYLQASDDGLLPPRAEQPGGDFSDDEFPDIHELGQRKRMRSFEKTRPLLEATNDDLADIPFHGTNHGHVSASESALVNGRANQHGAVMGGGHVSEPSKLSSNKTLSAPRCLNRSPCVGRTLSQAIDLTDN